MLLTNRQEISAYFVVPCNFFSVWAMNKYCTVAVCRSGTVEPPVGGHPRDRGLVSVYGRCPPTGG